MAIKLSSSVLTIIALTSEQLRLFVQDPRAYAANLGYSNYIPEPAVPDLLEALGNMIRSIETAPDLWPWNTNWAIISIQDNAIIGGIDFHGAPDAQGRVEIGYGLDTPFQHRGFMGQAVSLMVTWAFEHPEVKVIEAETYLGNWASQRVLQRKGFVPSRVEGKSLWWRLTPSQGR